jgi:hypothetical protein
VENKNLLLTPTISLNTIKQSVKMTVLFNVVGSSGNYIFKDDKPLRAPREKVVSYAFGTYRVLIDRIVIKTSKGAHSTEN